jgi:hypothetical protein
MIRNVNVPTNCMLEFRGGGQRFFHPAIPDTPIERVDDQAVF